MLTFCPRQWPFLLFARLHRPLTPLGLALGARNFRSSSSVIGRWHSRAMPRQVHVDRAGYVRILFVVLIAPASLVTTRVWLCPSRGATASRPPAAASAVALATGTACAASRGAVVCRHYVRSRSLVHRLRYNFLHTCKVGLTRPTHDTTETTVQRNPPTRVTRDRTRACAPQPQRHTSLDPGQSHEVKHSAPETQTQGVAALQTHCHGAPGCTSTLAHQHGGRAPSTRSRSRT